MINHLTSPLKFCMRTLALFIFLHLSLELLGDRTEVAILSGTPPVQDGNQELHALGGVLYIALYLLVVAVVPIVLLSTLLLAVIRRLIGEQIFDSPAIDPDVLYCFLVGSVLGFLVSNLDLVFLNLTITIVSLSTGALLIMLIGYRLFTGQGGTLLRRYGKILLQSGLSCILSFLLAAQLCRSAPAMLRFGTDILASELQSYHARTGSYPAELMELPSNSAITSLLVPLVCSEIEYGRLDSGQDYEFSCLRGIFDYRYTVWFSPQRGWKVQFLILDRYPRPT